MEYDAGDNGKNTNNSLFSSVSNYNAQIRYVKPVCKLLTEMQMELIMSPTSNFHQPHTTFWLLVPIPIWDPTQDISITLTFQDFFFFYLQS